jgi:hypothetical protein
MSVVVLVLHSPILVYKYHVPNSLHVRLVSGMVGVVLLQNLLIPISNNLVRAFGLSRDPNPRELFLNRR